MAIINSRIVRCKAIINAPFAAVGLIDVATNQTIETVRGNATRFQFAFYTANGAIADLSNVSSINLKIQPSQTPEGVSLADKTIPASELDLTTTDATWTSGTKQQAQFIFNNAEMNLAMTEVKKIFWLVVTAILTTGEEVTLAGGSIVWHEDNNATVGNPPVNLGAALSLEGGDARYSQIPLFRSTPPQNQVVGSGAAFAQATLVMPTQPNFGDSISFVHVMGYVFVFGTGIESYNIAVGGNVGITRVNIVNKINQREELPVTAEISGSNIILRSKTVGTTGNSIGINATPAGWTIPAYLSGGADGVSGAAGTPGALGQRALVSEVVGGNTVTTTWLCIKTSPFTWMREVNVHGGNILFGAHEIDGTLWVKNNAFISGALTVAGQLECNTSQLAATNNSAMTRGLTDARYVPLVPNDNVLIREISRRVEVGIRDTDGNASTGATATLGPGNSWVKLNLPATADAYVSRVVDFSYSHGSINYPEGVWFMMAISALINSADTFLFVGNYNPGDAANTARTSPYFPSSLATQESRWFLQFQRKPAGNSSSWQCRVVSRTGSGVYTEGAWTPLADESGTAHEKPLYLFMRIGSSAAGDSRTIRFHGLRAGSRRPLPANVLSDLVFLGETPVVTASYPQVIRVGAVSPTATLENVIMFHNPQCQGL